MRSYVVSHPELVLKLFLFVIGGSWLLKNLFMPVFVTAIKMVWSAGLLGNQVTLEQAPVQSHSSNKVPQNQSLAGILPVHLSVKYNSSVSVFVPEKRGFQHYL